MTNRMRWDPHMVLMPVPLHAAPRVARLLDQIESGQVSLTEAPDAQAALAEPGEAPETVAVPEQGAWTQTMIEQLVEATEYSGVLALLDRCAQVAHSEPEAWVLKGDVEEATNTSAVQLRNELGAFSKLTRRLFGQAIWPMQWKKRQGRYYYRMLPQIASWWQQAREGRHHD